MNISSPRRRDVTVADVAKQAKVSKAQAARALGNYGAVSDEVRERVLAAAEALQYHPNELARSMNTGKSNTIGVVVGDIENPHFGLAMRGISDAAKARGFDVILVNTGEDEAAEIDAVRVLLDKRVDGLIVAPAASIETKHLHRVHEAGRPLVLLDRSVTGLDVETVAVDMTEISYESTLDLLHAGHQRIAFISTLKTDHPYRDGEQLKSSQIAERVQGIRRAFHETNVPFDEGLIRLNAGDEKTIMEITDELLRGPKAATAIIASDGLIALSVVEAIQKAGLRIPQDVSFLMYDDFAWTRLTTPPLSVISQPVYEMGAYAARTLISHIEGNSRTEDPPVFTATLKKRQSLSGPAIHPRRSSSIPPPPGTGGLQRHVT